MTRTPASGRRSLAETYRDFGEPDPTSVQTPAASIAVAISESEAALAVIERAPVRRRQPALILACLYDLALSGRAPQLLAALSGTDSVATGAAGTAALLGHPDVVVATARHRQLRSIDVGRCATLLPAVAEAAHRGGTDTVGLIDLHCGAGMNLQVDRVGITYDTGQTVGDPTSAVQVQASVVGRGTVPLQVVPGVVARIGLDPAPIDVTDATDVRWLRACAGPGRLDQRVRLDAELSLVATTPPLLLPGNVVTRLAEAIDAVPVEALPVVTTTWALSRLTVEIRRHFLGLLQEIAADRPLAWVSLEGVGVAPSVPTLGDRPASGHSIIGVAVTERRTLRTEAVGRCWSRGRMLAWSTGSQTTRPTSVPRPAPR